MLFLKSIIAKRIKYLRKELGLSQEKLSELSGLPDTYVNKIENEKVNLQIDTLEKIINGLDVEYDEFFNVRNTETSNEIKVLINSLSELDFESQRACIEAFQLLLEQVKK